MTGVHGEGVKNNSGSRLLRFSVENKFGVMNIHIEQKENPQVHLEVLRKKSLADYCQLSSESRSENGCK